MKRREAQVARTLEQQYDVVIVGGGPGGAAAAAMLARAGRSVAVLERERFPRHHVGESLVGGVFPLFRELGVSERLAAAGFMQKRGSTHIWGDSFAPWSLYFNRENPADAYSYQVERSIFDQILLDHAEQCGARVLRGANATEVSFASADHVDVSYRADDGASATIRAQFLIDASGQRRFLSQHMQLVPTAYDPFFRNMAVYRYFSGHQLLDGVNRYNLFLEAVADGWFWYIPLHTGEVSAGVVVGQHALPALRRDGPDAFLAAQIDGTREVRRLLAAAAPVSASRVINNFSYEVERFSGDRCLLVGDAACFTDPMFASGVFLALRSGIQAGTTLDYALGHRDRWRDAAELYDREYRRLYQNARNAAMVIYHSNTLFAEHQFWQERRLTDEQLTAITADAAFMRELHPAGWLSYERLAFGQVQLPPLLDEQLRRLDRDRERRQREVLALMDNFGGWAPALRGSATMRPGLGFDGGYRVVEGMLVEDDGASVFVHDPLALAAIQATDGRRPMREILAAVLAAVPARDRLSRHLRLVAGFRDAHLRGLFGAAVEV